MNILLTGATGFVGKILTKRLLENGHHVFAVIRNEKKGEKLISSISPKLRNNLFILQGDISDDNLGISEELTSLLRDKIDTVYHSAAYLSFDQNDREKTFNINVNGTRRLLEFSKKINIKKFFYVSTAYTLGEDEFALEELHPLHKTFVNYYEESKCHAEHLAFEYRNAFSVSIFRPAIIIGDSNTGEADTSFGLYGIIKSFELLKRRIEKRERLQHNKFHFLCDPDTTQNLVPVNYVVDILSSAIVHAKRDKIYHITNPNPPTNQLISDLVQAYLGFNNVELSTDLNREMTKEEMLFNEPLKIFHNYMQRNITFVNANTKELLKSSNQSELYMDQPMLKRIIAKGNQFSYA
ncbi:SDR family oxidoreductase [Salirhabdus salicampi]|uniref:SDR family oxidoreductase n=1 Tax=Salirhabdus salicampi TaxID=476102 RepID=UPI0020C2E817|nr:SDR family oxidoreductase [Salirhabdus salicampi]MCP8616431.1 SDR family oxidoreductase [Salirhabdus salicampi]